MGRLDLTVGILENEGLAPWRTPSLPPANRRVLAPADPPAPASTPVMRTPGSSRNSKKRPMALLPPPTHATSSSGKPALAGEDLLPGLDPDQPGGIRGTISVRARP